MTEINKKTKKPSVSKERQRINREILAERIWHLFSEKYLKEEEIADKLKCSMATVSKVLTQKLKIKK